MDLSSYFRYIPRAQGKTLGGEEPSCSPAGTPAMETGFSDAPSHRLQQSAKPAADRGRGRRRARDWRLQNPCFSPAPPFRGTGGHEVRAAAQLRPRPGGPGPAPPGAQTPPYLTLRAAWRPSLTGSMVLVHFQHPPLPEQQRLRQGHPGLRSRDPP